MTSEVNCDLTVDVSDDVLGTIDEDLSLPEGEHETYPVPWHTLGSKSPLTGGFGESESGGYWGTELKLAGFDAIIIEGKAEKPVYIYIKDGQIEIKDAGHLWGMQTLECQEAIREELGDQAIKIAQIGPAGENLVRFACVLNDLDAVSGRTGMGAVMGSKNLKAVACRGHQCLSFADPQTVSSIGRWIRDNTPQNNKTLREHGAGRVVAALNEAGGLPTRNFQLGSIDNADKITGEAMTNTILVKRRSCFACPVQCKREVKVDEPYAVDPRYGGPEYETIASLGSTNCGITDLKAIAKGHELVNAYGLDSISCGMAISFAMECFENNILTLQDTEGIDLRFGNTQAMLQMIEKIAKREGLGNLLSQGVARASKDIGHGAEEYALHIKGQELPMHEPRWKQVLGVGYIVSSTGADHCHNIHDSNYTGLTPLLEDLKALGILEPLPVDDLSPAKVRMLTYHSNWIHFLNSAVCCFFVMVYGLVGFQRVSDLVSAVTGWNTSVFELEKVGERVANLGRMFNLMHGFPPQDDVMPQRFFTPQASGPLQGVVLDQETFLKAKEAYYEMMGWPGGRPSHVKLGELGIEWAEPMIEA